MNKEDLKGEIEERQKVIQKLRDKLWKIEDEEYLTKVKKVLGNFYLRTYGRGKNKEYSFVKLTGINKKRIEDKKGVKYFINCYHYLIPEKYESWEFKIQTKQKNETINITLFNTTRTIIQIEKFMEKTWKSFGSDYYEKVEEVKK